MTAKQPALRRMLRFASIDELLAELERIEAADRRGTLRTMGHWTAGQILAHLAAWIEYAYEGYPVKPPPFFVRWILRRMLRKILRDGMRPGVRIPGVQGGTTGADEMQTREAAQRLRNALQRLASREPARFASPAFGEMSDDDRIQLTLRHAELHLSYLSTEGLPSAS
ncbi:MAG: DUF1569 domain-containing protein [Planctomycetaceae bacterium]